MSAPTPRDPAPLARREVSYSCEVRLNPGVCGRQAVMAYPAQGGGYMSLCHAHGQPHAAYCVSLPDAFRGKQPDYPPTPRGKTIPSGKSAHRHATQERT